MKHTRWPPAVLPIKARLQCRPGREARRKGYSIASIRIRHAQFAEAAARRIRKLMALREADPDDMDARQYTHAAFDWVSALQRMGFTQWKGSYYHKLFGKYQILVYPTSRKDNSVDVQVFQSTGQARACIGQEFVVPTMVEQTINGFIKQLGIKEALDPDDIDARQYVQTAFDWKSSLARLGFTVARSFNRYYCYSKRTVGNHQIVPSGLKLTKMKLNFRSIN